MTNPILEDWQTAFALPPFDRISNADFAAAFEAAISQSRTAVDAIANTPAPPSFDNTITALETADRLLDKTAGLFFNLVGANADETLEALQRDLAPKLAALSAETLMNQALFQRIDTLARTSKTLGLTAEQDRVLTLYHRMFKRAGAALDSDSRTRLKDVTERLAILGTTFSQNLLADERAWFMPLADADLSSLPASLVDAARSAARERGRTDHVITLSRSLIVPFLQSCPDRDLRRQAYEAWQARGANGGQTDNLAIVRETLALREERAHLLGFDTFAAFKLAPEMAKTPEAVRTLLMDVWKPARAQAIVDQALLEDMLHEDGINGQIEPWDWHYYAERRRLRDHALDDAALKPYFPLDRVIEAAFDVANRLFGLTFHRLDAPLYHPDARAWEVRKGTRHMAVFIGDYFARPSKRSGAWCSRFRTQSRLAPRGEQRPITVNVCNFAKAPDGQPTLLTPDDALTLFHEFGHALHSMLSDVTYPFISGTSVARDFVELPSQLYEHWLTVPDVLRKHARHVDTGAPIPEDLLARLLAARNYDQGFRTVEYTASALVDLDFHAGPAPADPMARQAELLASLGMPHGIRMRHATPHFAHVFSGDGYSSGYYSYMWSEVMDADAFNAFEDAGDPFDEALARKLETHIYSAGGSQEPEALYTAFRGSLPGVEALLKGRGFLESGG